MFFFRKGGVGGDKHTRYVHTAVTRTHKRSWYMLNTRYILGSSVAARLYTRKGDTTGLPEISLVSLFFLAALPAYRCVPPMPPCPLLP